MTRLVYILALITMFSCSRKKENTNEIVVFSASGARLPVTEICKSIKDSLGYSSSCNYASSGVLARQIANGANCHIYVSANKQWIDYLESNDFVESSSIKSIASNKLVIVAPSGLDVKAPVFKEEYDLNKNLPSRIAIGNPDYVPVGKYAKNVLDTLGWYSLLADKAILGKDVSSVLKYVELGECDWGIVYYTEAIQSNKVKIIAEIPGGLYSPIDFYVAKLKSKELKGDNAFDFFTSKDALAVLERFGFTTI